ncbi:TlpA disulfide reductase family protein [Halalkalibacter alkaliphilus]|uniref:TlpA family protein disulfide reductase n=1 Tax=Halalkalibacter alkaliphilus TaxID=2917993 RepID=A0A9X1ZX51_9BACI|nr:TlpA disulfide reductase family protein [Halalkalibacter alkaliphilus]MCL7745971.1 TlpA family protein disulfide reductase [Halalkalibacter alkaliphilus]
MKQAPDFTLPMARKDMEWSLEEATKKVTMISFWTSWCPDSQRDLQAKQVLYQSMETDQIDMYMIHVTGRDPEVDVNVFLEKNGYTFPVLKDKGTKVYDLYQCMGVPTTVLLNEKKEVAFIYHDKATIMEIMKGVTSILEA